MARIFVDSFQGDGNVWDFCNTVIVQNRAGFGEYCTYIGVTTFAQKIFPTTYPSLYFKWRVEPEKFSNSGSLYSQFGLMNGATNLGYLSLANGSGYYGWYSGGFSAGTLRATSSIPVIIGRVHLIELYVLPHTSAGTVILKIDGQVAINFTNGITSSSATEIKTVYFGGTALQAGYSYAWVGDVVIDDASWIGPSRVGYRTVSGVGNYTQFTPIGLASNFQNVDEKPVSVADYNYTNTSNYIDSFTLGTLQTGNQGWIPAAVKSFSVNTKIRKTGSPTPTRITPFIRSVSVDDVKGSTIATDALIPANAIWETNPATSASWALTDNPEIGYKSLA